MRTQNRPEVEDSWSTIKRCIQETMNLNWQQNLIFVYKNLKKLVEEENYFQCKEASREANVNSYKEIRNGTI